ncbi:XdhC family protein [Rhodohalobacter sulfatireducens]|uniref:XdhC family protein n=1 Tax=Rhodohalobacter sulfatireducens TaxID=2911366 RepID=A0ABS9K8V5_9BACT|nr:XdhC/CoxI family protein [Rhodohalobacter sulfatireducens]MCG2587281.1 XdhC family protein [Rhodohalobacter sulfatireducens]
MREIESIISAYEEKKNKDQKSVLATVVHVEGSSYRAAGARMLVDEYGFMTGAISGGCLEGDALRKALLALDQNKNKLVTYDTSDEDDAIIGAQLGCNGIIQVLFEPIDPGQENNPIELLKIAESYDQPVALVSIFNLDKTKDQVGTTLLIDEKGESTGKIDKPALSEKIHQVAGNSLEKRLNHFGEYHTENDTQNAFTDIITPPLTLVLVGAGNDSQVLSRMAEVLGWDIIVADGRPTHANEQRFSSCQVVVTNPEEILDDIRINETTAFVLMTHNYNYDLAVLKLLLNEEKIPYIGILGPNKKYQRMLGDLAADGIELTNEQSAKIYAPVGLQLGAETPAEIGLSILSEIQAVLTGSDVHHLRELEGSIHKKELYEFKSIEL